jgi:hypothetical protein
MPFSWPFGVCDCLDVLLTEALMMNNVFFSATLFLENWKRKNNELSYEWGMTDYKNRERVRYDPCFK